MDRIKQYSQLWDWAAKAHEGQTRRDGHTPYFNHCMRVATSPYIWDGDHKLSILELASVGIFHDVLEDTDVTAEDMRKAGISEVIIKAVETITKKKGQSYSDYLTEVKANELARIVKIVDMLANLSDNPTEKQILKYAQGLTILLT